MPLSYRETSQPAVEPVSLTTAKLQCCVDFEDDDALIAAYITAARQYVEKATQRSIYNRTMTLNLDYFPISPYGADQYSSISSYIRALSILCPKPGLVSVQSITYLSAQNTPITLSPTAYMLDTSSEPGRIFPAAGCYWPYQSQYLPGQVQVNYTSGTYGDGVTVDNCPQTLKLAIQLLVSHWYSHREATTEATLSNIPLGVDHLLAGEKFTTVY